MDESDSCRGGDGEGFHRRRRRLPDVCSTPGLPARERSVHGLPRLPRSIPPRTSSTCGSPPRSWVVSRGARPRRGRCVEEVRSPGPGRAAAPPRGRRDRAQLLSDPRARGAVCWSTSAATTWGRVSELAPYGDRDCSASSVIRTSPPGSTSRASAGRGRSRRPERLFPAGTVTGRRRSAPGVSTSSSRRSGGLPGAVGYVSYRQPRLVHHHSPIVCQGAARPSSRGRDRGGLGPQGGMAETARRHAG